MVGHQHQAVLAHTLDDFEWSEQGRSGHRIGFSRNGKGFAGKFRLSMIRMTAQCRALANLFAETLAWTRKWLGRSI
jgi:hypothetical protein